MKISVLGAATLVALLIGCAEPPARKDPFANLQATNPALKKLSVALILSENTKDARAYLDTRHLAGKIDHPDRVFTEAVDVFRRGFGDVVKVDRLSDLNSHPADLAVVLDVYAKIATTMMVDYKAIFMTPDGRQIDAVQAHGTQSQLSYISFGLGSYLDDATNKARDQLESAIQSSAKLAEFARVKSGAPQAASVAAAPAEPEIRSDVDVPGRRLAERPDDFALVVGVEKYSNDLPSAQFAERDARAVKAHLLALGVPERNVKFLIGSRASLSALSAYLEDWLPRNVKDDSRVYFYFSGHGAPSPESGQAYLVPWDGNPNFLDKTALPVKKLYADLGALKARRVVIALDSCFSGAGGRSVLAAGARPLVTKVDASIAPGSKLLLFAAASPSEITSTLPEQGHGIFTYYFLKGLSGAAATASGSITPRSLYAYLKPRVQDAASRQNRDQTPVLEGAVQDALVDPSR